MRPPRVNIRSKARSEAGSAYIVTLLALVVLTILALTLTLVTQSEVQIGGAEKTVNRLFYSSDGVLTLAAPKVALGIAQTDTTYSNRVHIGSGANSSNTADREVACPPAPMTFYCCDKCECTNTSKYFDVTYMVTVASQRVGWKGDAMPDTATPVEVLGSKTLEMNLLGAPLEKPDPKASPQLNPCPR